MRLLPDPASLVTTGDGVARAVVRRALRDGTPWPGDPRTAARDRARPDRRPRRELRALGRARVLPARLRRPRADRLGRLLHRRPRARHGRGPRPPPSKLESWGIGVDSIHHEAGPGQYEIDLAELPAIELADALVLAKQTVRETAADAGLTATFMPRPLSDEPGSGLHLHQRVADRLADDDGLLTEEGRGVPRRPARARAWPLGAGVPTVNSYKRLHSGPEAPSTAVWAHANRGALIRLSPTGADGATHRVPRRRPVGKPVPAVRRAHHRAPLTALARRLDLPPAVEEESERLRPGRSRLLARRPLPRDLEEALSALQNDDVLVDAFDAQLLSRLLDGRRRRGIRIPRAGDAVGDRAVP